MLLHLMLYVQFSNRRGNCRYKTIYREKNQGNNLYIVAENKSNYTDQKNVCYDCIRFCSIPARNSTKNMTFKME